MDDTPTHPREPRDADSQSDSDNAKIQLGTGMEPNLGDFTRTQGLLKSLRLSLNNQIVVPVEELASAVSEAGRKFKMVDLEQANQDVTRLYSVFRQKTSQWESQARNLEQQMRMQSAKNPKSISIDTMNRMKAEQTAVRTRIRSTEVQCRRLHQALDQAFTVLQSRSVTPPEGPSEMGSDFLAAFKTAAPVDRPSIIKQSYEIEAVLKVTIVRASNEYKLKFDPLPPLDRLYFLTTTAQLIRRRAKCVGVVPVAI